MPAGSSSSMGSGGGVGILGGGKTGPSANISSRDIIASAGASPSAGAPPSLGASPSAGASPSLGGSPSYKREIYFQNSSNNESSENRCMEQTRLPKLHTSRIFKVNKDCAFVMELYAFEDANTLLKKVITALGGGGGGGGGVGGLGGIFFGIGGRLKLKIVLVKSFNSNDLVVSFVVSAAWATVL